MIKLSFAGAKDATSFLWHGPVSALATLGIFALFGALYATVPGLLESTGRYATFGDLESLVFFLPAQVLLTAAIIIALYRKFGGPGILIACLFLAAPLTIFLSSLNYRERTYSITNNEHIQAKRYVQGVPFITQRGYEFDNSQPETANFEPPFKKHYRASYIANYLIVLLALYLIVGPASGIFRAAYRD